jgi:dTMP kinase
MRGSFVVLEGGDGSGKSTQVARLAATLRARGDLLLHGPDAISPMAEALLMAADRAQHVTTEIAPALARGEWVVCDRYVPSSLVYQGAVRGIGVEVVSEINAIATGGLAPDLVVVLDVDDPVARSRRGGALDRLERESQEFHAEIRQAYRDLAGSHGWIVVDGTGDVDAVAHDVEDVVERLMAR